MHSQASAERITDMLDAALLDGFHAMAQPLTILQSRIESELIAGRAQDGSGAFLESLAIEVERLSSLLRPLRQLVAARSCREAPGVVDVWEIVAPVLEDFALFFANLGVDFEIVPVPGPVPSAAMAPHTLCEIVTGILSAAAAAAAPSDWVYVRLDQGETGLTLTVANRSAQPRLIPTSVRLNLSVAQVRALLQGAEMVLTQSPFSVRLVLPSAAVPIASCTHPSCS